MNFHTPALVAASLLLGFLLGLWFGADRTGAPGNFSPSPELKEGTDSEGQPSRHPMPKPSQSNPPTSNAAERSRAPAPEILDDRFLPRIDASAQCTVRLRLVLENQRPWSDSDVRVWVRFGQSKTPHYPHTDANGWIEVPISGSAPIGRGTIEVRPGSRPHPFRITADPPTTRLARVELPEQLPIGTLDLGDVRVAEAPVIASGIALDDQSRPLDRARVDFALVGSPRNALDSVLTGTDGRFEYRRFGEWNRGTVSLSVDGKRMFGPTPFGIGAQGLVLR